MAPRLQLLLLSLLLFSNSLKASIHQIQTSVTLKYSVDFILDQILAYQNRLKQNEIEIPQVYLASKVSLTQFQDAVEPQWGNRPENISNVFVFSRNEIYLADDRKYYEDHGRCIDDSLAHELTHYIQFKYQHMDMNDEFLEFDAIEVQNWFRDRFCK